MIPSYSTGICDSMEEKIIEIHFENKNANFGNWGVRNPEISRQDFFLNKNFYCQKFDTRKKLKKKKIIL